MAQNLSKKFDHFLSQNSDLIDQYEILLESTPVEYLKEEIISTYKDIQKKLKNNIDFNSLLINSFTQAIIKECPVMDLIKDIALSQEEVQDKNSLQTYFKEINNIYNQNGNDYNIEYCEENRDKLISLNTKTVISIAKKYQGLGLSLPELISAGNLGLVVAWDKFDPSRARLKEDIMDLVENMPESFSGKELINVINPFLKYGDIQKKFLSKFSENEIFSKHEAKRWIQLNIFSAKFSSIATMWIRAYILIEIDNYSRIVKKPKSEIYKDREKYGAYKKEITLDIDAPINGDEGAVFGDLISADNSISDIETLDAYSTFRDGLMKLLDGVKSRDRSIFLKKFGIGMPRPMLPKEIADQEGLSIARISQIFQSVIEQMQKNAIKYNIDPTILFDVVKQFS